MLARYVGRDVAFAHKTGAIDGVRHDAGLLRASGASCSSPASRTAARTRSGPTTRPRSAWASRWPGPPSCSASTCNRPRGCRRARSEARPRHALLGRRGRPAPRRARAPSAHAAGGRAAAGARSRHAAGGLRSPNWPRAAPRRTCPAPTTSPRASGESDAESRAGAEAAGLPWDAWKVRADLAVIALAWERRLPLLGVCGGMQAMVVFAGGTLRAGHRGRGRPARRQSRGRGRRTGRGDARRRRAGGRRRAELLPPPGRGPRQRAADGLGARGRRRDRGGRGAARRRIRSGSGCSGIPSCSATRARSGRWRTLHAERVVAGGQVAVVVGGQRRLGGAAHARWPPGSADGSGSRAAGRSGSAPRPPPRRGCAPASGAGRAPGSTPAARSCSGGSGARRAPRPATARPPCRGT